ncbi:MAG: sugar phosphate isomerase/epimerase [Acidobacteriia bacterium]|nr:sugar phosphate isomerase/epimerase [Terriglobia bacterium]
MKVHSVFSRRDFLATAGVALAATVVRAGAEPGNQQAEPSAVRFGVRGPLRERTIRERALLLQRLGYQGIELGDEFVNRSAESIQAELAGTGIAVSAITGSLQLLDTDPRVRARAIELDRQRLEMARALGASGLIEVPVFGPNRFQDLSPVMTPREIEDRLLVAALKQLAADVARTGVNLLIEPLTKKETHYMNLQEHGVEIIKAVGAPGFKLLSDFYHMQMEEKDIAVTLTACGAYTGYVHLADGVKRTEPGSLPFDYRPGFRALKKAGFSGWLTVESGATDNPTAALTRALKYIQPQWNEA